uniref:Uncharacterized protein n=1 Tax=Aegilops tauschii subsp. strangulata TaxID=200361 RepID=A0A453SSE5_AEGTS
MRTKMYALLYFSFLFIILVLLLFVFDIFFVYLQADNFLVNLSREVSLRLQGCGLQGRTITLKR